VNAIHTESSMTRLLEKRYAPPHYAFLSQVRNGTGFQRRTVRTADGLAMSLWPSRGIHLNGFEIKVSLADFKKEVSTPEKAEDIAQHCHFWWIVAPNTKVAPLEMMPPGWGLLILDDAGEKLVVAKEALLNKDPVTPDWLMIASILRNASESMIPLATLKEYKEKFEDGVRASEAARTKHQLESMGQRAKELVEKEQALREVFADYNQWNVDGFIDQYKMAKRLISDGQQLLASYRHLVEGVKRIEPVLEEIKKGLKS